MANNINNLAITVNSRPRFKLVSGTASDDGNNPPKDLREGSIWGSSSHFTIVPNAVLRSSLGLSDRAHRTLCALLSWGDWARRGATTVHTLPVSQEKLARDRGGSADTIKRGVAELDAAGFITRCQVAVGKRNRYTIHLDRIETATLSGTEGTSALSRRADLHPVAGQICTPTEGRSAPTEKKPSVEETPSNQPRRSAVAGRSAEIPSGDRDSDKPTRLIDGRAVRINQFDGHCRLCRQVLKAGEGILVKNKPEHLSCPSVGISMVGVQL